MGLPWVRLDTQFPSNPKVLELVADKQYRAVFAYVCSLAYCGQHGTDGYVPTTALPFIHATKRDAEILVTAGMWKPAPGGWDVNGWDEFQVSDEAAKRRRERAQKGAAARWEKARKETLRSV
ncbi:hypothetical protein SEA_PIPER2020_88 [Mycobacterium phage Piper2020]|nr:hypothetical protein SEA_PIPER2020_88 [Mycobacterium phage Piper2020]